MCRESATACSSRTRTGRSCGYQGCAVEGTQGAPSSGANGLTMRPHEVGSGGGGSLTRRISNGSTTCARVSTLRGARGPQHAFLRRISIWLSLLYAVSTCFCAPPSRAAAGARACTRVRGAERAVGRGKARRRPAGAFGGKVAPVLLLLSRVLLVLLLGAARTSTWRKRLAESKARTSPPPRSQTSHPPRAVRL